VHAREQQREVRIRAVAESNGDKAVAQSLYVQYRGAKRRRERERNHHNILSGNEPRLFDVLAAALMWGLLAEVTGIFVLMMLGD
jgi:hypothetical protein